MDKFFDVYSSICSKIYRGRIKELWDFGKEGIISEGEDARLLEVLKEHEDRRGSGLHWTFSPELSLIHVFLLNNSPYIYNVNV